MHVNEVIDKLTHEGYTVFRNVQEAPIGTYTYCFALHPLAYPFRFSVDESGECCAFAVSLADVDVDTPWYTVPCEGLEDALQESTICGYEWELAFNDK